MQQYSLLPLFDSSLEMESRIDLPELFDAYAACRRTKRNTINATAFEMDYEHNLLQLAHEINSGSYQPSRSIAFVLNKPVQREIFAADFRDRVVHHWVIHKLNPLFEQAFIYDSYACRIDKGVHFGIGRVDRFIRRCSGNYTRDSYILKLDIQGFFMAINKAILASQLNSFIQHQYHLPDQALLLELCHKILRYEPVKNCFIKGRRRDWQGLPPDKSLFHSKPGCGLPIGNLTSQIFANFYLNPFDHFIKHDLGVRYYGRYCDDFVLVHQDKDYLNTLVPQIADFLKAMLGLTLHPRKIYLQHYSKGVNFLGVTIKPNRIYAGKRIKGNFYDAIARHNHLTRECKPTKEEQAAFLCSMNSYLGIMKHYNTYGLRKKMLIKHLSVWWWNLMYCSGGFVKLVSKQRTVRY
ncbi:reverse transcriptase/maturase family protein [uncultured Legionella sp.]|uniref:reverse transcriptase/maturase family protein n=1 Tax=uncultured Legionella sp. TaxID=210934 RepID=UPI002632C603|nr:reverse transcriptase/maturase family protein [uncultured Legionella sp.]